jgi:SAM-dependent methyltransferase
MTAPSRSVASRAFRRGVRMLVAAPREQDPLDEVLARVEGLALPEGPRVNLGCGAFPIDGWVNVDVTSQPSVDVMIDRDGGLPIGTATCSLVLAMDVIEHGDHISLIREIHRVLRPGGIAILSTPHYSSRFLWVDPTHRRGFSVDSFDYFAAGFQNPNDYYFDFAFARLDLVWLTFGFPRRYRHHEWLERWTNAGRARLRRYEETPLVRMVPGLDLWIVLQK